MFAMDQFSLLDSTHSRNGANARESPDNSRRPRYSAGSPRNGKLIENPDSWRKIRETTATVHRDDVLGRPLQAKLACPLPPRRIDTFPRDPVLAVPDQAVTRASVSTEV